MKSRSVHRRENHELSHAFSEISIHPFNLFNNPSRVKYFSTPVEDIVLVDNNKNCSFKSNFSKNTECTTI